MTCLLTMAKILTKKHLLPYTSKQRYRLRESSGNKNEDKYQEGTANIQNRAHRVQFGYGLQLSSLGLIRKGWTGDAKDHPAQEPESQVTHMVGPVRHSIRSSMKVLSAFLKGPGAVVSKGKSWSTCSTHAF